MGFKEGLEKGFVEGDGFELLLRSVIAFHGQGKMDAPIVRQGTESWIEFKTGLLHASIW